jgi:O-antigen biosynthesis protein
MVVENIKRIIRWHPHLHSQAKRWKQKYSHCRTRLPEVHELQTPKERYSQKAKEALQEFFFRGVPLEFPRHEAPTLSILLVLYNKAELTYACLSSLLQERNVSFEVIAIDNSTELETQMLFESVKGVRYIKSEENLHFLRGSNKASILARAPYLLFLNNDTEVPSGSIASALRTLEGDTSIGAVGARIILPDGTLQEAGSIVWKDGTCLGYGRGDNPRASQYLFQRDVDYCSGAFLLTPRALFESLGRFDEAYAPAYYEEVDYCLRLWESGKRVVYEPRVLLYHFEFGSSTVSEHALQMQRERQKLFKERRKSLVATKLLPASEHVLCSRSVSLPSSSERKKRFLLIDERIPHQWYGAGYPRARAMLYAAIELGWEVTLYPAVWVDPLETYARIYESLPSTVEVMALAPWGPGGLSQFFKERKGHYDVIMVSRPSTLEAVKRELGDALTLRDAPVCVYDAEALFSLRDAAYARLTGKPLSPEAITAKITEELAPARAFSRITTVSAQEARHFSSQGFKHVSVVSHAIQKSASTELSVPSYESRKHILFLGAVHGDHGPNFDSLQWFLNDVFPHILRKDSEVRFTIAGYHQSSFLSSYSHPQVDIIGRVEDPSALYQTHRVNVAPTRFAAGIPLKVIEAAQYGIPSVVTPLLHQQLEWREQEEIMVGESAQAFAACVLQLLRDRHVWGVISGGSRARVEKEYAFSTFKESLLKIV